MKFYVPSLITICLLFWGPILAHFGMISGLAGMLIAGTSVLTGIVTVCFGFYWVVKSATAPGMVSLAGGLLPIVLAAHMMYTNRGYPRINDISTNLQAPPQLVEAERILGKSLPFDAKTGDLVR